jgi:DNA-damage-inducible protein D
MDENQTEYTSPDFEKVRQESQEGIEYWSARELAPLLGYITSWQNFELAIKRAKTACVQIGQLPENHFNQGFRKVKLTSGQTRNVKDYRLSRFACYLVAQNGDPRKPEIAAAQAYFAVATREHELYKLYEDHQDRIRLREQVDENNEALREAALKAGVLPRNFGQFENAGYEGLYGGLDVEDIKTKKGIEPKENLLDRMGRLELATNSFRIAQTEDKLNKDRIIGLNNATEAHRHVGKVVRKAIKELEGTMPEELPAEPSIKPVLNQKKRQRRKELKQEE